jgi:23S rRNA pseudouridine1911/1915/1917 synthase
MTPREWAVIDADAGIRLDKFLAAPGRLASRRRVSVALELGQVFLNGAETDVASAGRRLSAGDVVRLWLDRPGSASRRASRPKTVGHLRILYEDEALLVIDKPPGVLTIPLERKAGADSVYDFLVDHLRSHGKRRPLVVHRIDRDTSGLVVFAKDVRTQQALKDQFRRREPTREYWAVVYGHPAPPAGTWRDRLVWDQRALIQKETHPNDASGMDAVSRYRTLESFAETSLLAVTLETGKRNQIRIQARLRGHTLVGEKRYVYGPEALRPIAFERQALHARRLTFRHPGDGRPLAFESPVPADLTDLLARLRRT